MLARERRISKDRLAEILKNSRNFNAPAVSLRVAAKNDGSLSSFGVVVSTKTAPKSHDRNFLKRRTRHVLRKHLSELKNGFYCVLFLKQDLSPLPFPKFEQTIVDGLKYAGLLK